MNSTQFNFVVIRGFVAVLALVGVIASAVSMTRSGYLPQSLQTLLVGLPFYVWALRYGFTGRASFPKVMGQWWQIAYGACLAGVALSGFLFGNPDRLQQAATAICLLVGTALVVSGLLLRLRTTSAA